MTSISCKVCSHPFSKKYDDIKTPRVLPCGHTICHECVLKISNKTNLCPLRCGVPINGVGNSKVNYLVIEILENKDCCNECSTDYCSPKSLFCLRCKTYYCSLNKLHNDHLDETLNADKVDILHNSLAKDIDAMEHFDKMLSASIEARENVSNDDNLTFEKLKKEALKDIIQQEEKCKEAYRTSYAALSKIYREMGEVFSIAKTNSDSDGNFQEKYIKYLRLKDAHTRYKEIINSFNPLEYTLLSPQVLQLKSNGDVSHLTEIDKITSISVCSSGRFVAVSGNNGILEILKYNYDNKVYKNHKTLTIPVASVTGVKFKSYSTLYVYTGCCILKVMLDEEPFIIKDLLTVQDPIVDIAFTADHLYVLTDKNYYQIFDKYSLTYKDTVESKTPLKSLQFLYESKTPFNGKLKVFECNKGTFGEVLLENGKINNYMHHIATTNKDVINIYCSIYGSIIRTLEFNGCDVMNFCFNNEGRYFAVATINQAKTRNDIYVYRTLDYECVFNIVGFNKGVPITAMYFSERFLFIGGDNKFIQYISFE